MNVKKLSAFVVLLMFAVTSCKRQEVFNYHYHNTTSSDIEIVEYRDSIGPTYYHFPAQEESIESSGTLTRGNAVFRMNYVDSLKMIFNGGKTLTFYNVIDAEVDVFGEQLPSTEANENVNNKVYGYATDGLGNILKEENWKLETTFGETRTCNYYFDISDVYLQHAK